ncbi:hypothetical protein GUJ93_ZPchr0044g38096 [Zizania palustris]|nr:hypothetical protein GUJ93_ZPchr0044g38096 [Zizania palustris]
MRPTSETPAYGPPPLPSNTKLSGPNRVHVGVAYRQVKAQTCAGDLDILTAGRAASQRRQPGAEEKEAAEA